MARPQFDIAQSGEARRRSFGLETHGDSRGHFFAAGDIPRGRVRVLPAGGIRRRRGPETCPPTRSLSPAGRECTPTRRMSPRVSCGIRSILGTHPT